MLAGMVITTHPPVPSAGSPPARQYDQVHWRVPRELLERLRLMAERERRTVNSQAVYLLERALDDEP